MNLNRSRRHSTVQLPAPMPSTPPSFLPVTGPRTPASRSTPPPDTLQPSAPFGSPGSFQLLPPSPTVSPPRSFPFSLDKVPAYVHLLLQLPTAFDSIFTPNFPYGAIEAIYLSFYDLMCIFLFTRQVTRFAAISRILHLDNEKLFFLGTWIKGVTIPEIPYRPASGKLLCSFGCGRHFTNRTGYIRHQKPKLYSFEYGLNPCLQFPTLFLCESGRKFFMAMDLEAEGGLTICYHTYSRPQFSEHWRTQVRQVSHTLLDFALTKLRVTDERVLRWMEVDKMHF